MVLGRWPLVRHHRKSLKNRMTTRKTCRCEVCRYGRKIRVLFARQTTRRDQAMLQNLYDRLCDAEQDRDVLKAKLRGLWPGWESVEAVTKYRENLKSRKHSSTPRRAK